MFEEMVSAIQDETVRRLYSVRLRKDEEVKRERVAKATVENVGGDGTTPKKQPVKKTVKIGRNDPCPIAGNRHLHRYYNFTELTVETASRSLHHSCRSELTRQGISLP